MFATTFQIPPYSDVEMEQNGQQHRETWVPSLCVNYSLILAA